MKDILFIQPEGSEEERIVRDLKLEEVRITIISGSLTGLYTRPYMCTAAQRSQIMNKVPVEFTTNAASALLSAGVGDFIVFKDEKQKYTIQARDNRFLICTKPFNVKRTVLYSILDLSQDIRGVETRTVVTDFATPKGCAASLDRLSRGSTEVSQFNSLPIRIAKVIQTKTKPMVAGFNMWRREDHHGSI